METECLRAIERKRDCESVCERESATVINFSTFGTYLLISSANSPRR